MPSTHQPRIFNTVNLTDFDTNGQTSTVGEPTVSTTEIRYWPLETGTPAGLWIVAKAGRI